MRPAHKIDPVPYISGKDDPGWSVCSEKVWTEAEGELNKIADKLTAVIFEPVLQGAAGMMVYSPAFFSENCAPGRTKNDVHLIARRNHDGIRAYRQVFRLRPRRNHAGFLPCLQRAHIRLGAFLGCYD